MKVRALRNISFPISASETITMKEGEIREVEFADEISKVIALGSSLEVVGKGKVMDGGRRMDVPKEQPAPKPMSRRIEPDEKYRKTFTKKQGVE